MTTSANHKLLTDPIDIENTKILKEAWKHPELPMRQWNAFEKERKLVEEGNYNAVEPFRAYLSCADYIDKRELGAKKDILDVGASSGYYHDLLRAGGFSNWHYTASDYSPYFRDHAAKVLPHVRFDIADICDLPYADKTYDIVSCGIEAIHLDDWKTAISEVARVARQYVIFHRVFTIITPTEFYLKTGYDIPMTEIWYNDIELFAEFKKNNLEMVYGDYVFTTEQENKYGQWDFVCVKK